MKTLLMYVTPPGQDDDYIAMPLGIIYLGAIVKEAGLEIECLDERVSTEEEVKEAIARNDIIGLSALTPHVGRAVRWGEYAKGIGKRVMMGGPHATVDPDTGRVTSSRTLTEGADFRVDYLQGVLILNGLGIFKENHVVRGANLIDMVPTFLHALGLQPGY